MMIGGNTNPAVLEEQQAVISENNIVNNYLRIPLIEIEQLNPRISQLNGAMKVKYWAAGGEEEGVTEYDYQWVGGEIKFIQNPYPRVPLGTGAVAWIQDDAGDPVGDNRVHTPEGSKSGEPIGWNRELLASHYGDCYWRIVDPEIDKQIRERYRKILMNILAEQAVEAGEDYKIADIQKKADEMVQKAVDIQVNRTSGQKVVVRARTPGKIEERVVGDETEKQKIDNQEIKDLTDKNFILQQQNEMLLKRLEKLEQGQAEQEQLAKKEAPVKKKLTPKEKSQKMNEAKKKKKIEKETAQAQGNLGG